MAPGAPPDLRRQVGSPSRPKGRAPDRDTLCRNISIYGKCRYENAGCSFNHEHPINSNNSSNNNHVTSMADMKKAAALNGDSPSFTPSSLSSSFAKKPSTLPSQAASAAVFTPRAAGTGTPAPSEPDRSFNFAAIKEFTPAQNNYDLGSSGAQTVPATPDASLAYQDPFTPIAPAQFNPYATGNDHSSLAGASAYYQSQGAYASPLQPPAYHLYANIGPYREDLLPYQRQTRDFFMSDELREELQKKAHAARQAIPNSIQLEAYHSLVPLDSKVESAPQRKNASIFGWITHLFKATSTKTGRIYCLRRVLDYRMGDREATKAIETIKQWKHISNGNIVSVHEAFTTSAFGDRSLVFCQDYFPLAQTMVEAHLTQPPKDNRYRGTPLQLSKVPEHVIWLYVVQIANALKAIHARDLAARCLDPSKIIVTDRHRIRLTACAILDVIQPQSHRPLSELQEDDFLQFGRLILCLATGKLPNQIVDAEADLATLSRRYQASPKGESSLRDLVFWLLSAPDKTAANLIKGIAPRMAEAYDAGLQHVDFWTAELSRELENGRIARLMMKLGMINERSLDHDPSWSEHGERYPLKLFRDYVFHRVDDHGRPVFDIGHMVNSLNKLDAGSAELVRLTTRDNQCDFIISFAELKKQLNGSFAELMKHNRRT